MKAYYAKSDHIGKKKFLYVKLEPEQADQVPRNARTQLHDHGTQIHLTTDGTFELYCEKRLETPRLVKILDTQKQIEAVLESMGFVL